MVPIILDKRKSKIRSGRAFNKLIPYVEGHSKREQQHAVSPNQKFENILNYTTSHEGARTGSHKCIAIRTNCLTDIASATLEMNAVSARNTRCKSPAFHFVLAWPEFERPAHNLIFEAAEHAIKSLGLGEHQYVLAIHGDTDNIHCHAAVNRIHPVTFKSRNIEWANKTLHMAARQSEIKHGWSHDNGIYIVEMDEHNKKSIVLNPDHDHTIPHAHHDYEQKIDLPAWHDPESLESWLRIKVARALKHDLPELTSWHALHVWLAKYDIKLSDSGGGGMRLHVTSSATGEVLDIAASKGLRILKRTELENRWGAFATEITTSCLVPDLFNLSSRQIRKGVDRYLKSSLDRGIPPAHLIYADEIKLQQDIAAGVVLDAVDAREKINANHGNTKRAERRAQRAAARAELRQRFAQYCRLVCHEDVGYSAAVRELRAERSQKLQAIRAFYKTANSQARKEHRIGNPDRLSAMADIYIENIQLKLHVKSDFQEKSQKLRELRVPPLGWREWLYEQSNLGDQAALSALRGIVYQAQRDARRGSVCLPDVFEDEQGRSAGTYREQQFKIVMSRLLEEEKREIAIRAARSNDMRPYEVDALLRRYGDIQWRVTGNGNVAYSDRSGTHLFTDRGNRITFDRVHVTDEEIRYALMHARQKFGNQLTLTGDDPVFVSRMACQASDMGIQILNPELQVVIANHRHQCDLENAEELRALSAQHESMEVVTHAKSSEPEQRAGLIEEVQLSTQSASLPIEATVEQTPQERLRTLVLAIDPRAEFVMPGSTSHVQYNGPIAVTLPTQPDSHPHGFAQHLGRGVYALHLTPVPENHNDASVEVHYRDGQIVSCASEMGVGKGQGE